MRDFNDLIPAFVEESLEHLKNIEENITAIEQGNQDIKLVNRVFRKLHSVKGGASFLGLKKIEKLSWVMEDILNRVKNNEIEFTSKLSSCILKAVAKLQNMLENTDRPDDFNIDTDIKELKKCLKTKPIDRVTQKRRTDIESASVKIDRQTLDTLRKQGKKIYLVQFELKEESLGGKNPLDLFNEVDKAGEILVRNVDMELVLRDHKFSGEGLPLSILYASVLEKDLVSYIFGIDENIIKEVKPGSLFEEEVIGPVSIEKEDKKGLRNMNIDVDSYFIEAEEEAIPSAKVAGATTYAEFEDGSLEETGKTVEPAEPVAVESPGEKGMEYLTFLVENKLYGITVTEVCKVVPVDEMTPVPFEKDSIKGVLNLKGEIVPVYDFRLKLKVKEKAFDKETVIVIVLLHVSDSHDKKIGIIADRVSDIIRLKKQEITDAHRVKKIPPEYVDGLGKKEEQAVILLKLEEMFGLEHR